MIKLLHLCLTMFAVSYLIQDTLSRRMSLRAKRKKVLRQMLEKEARLRNDTLMMRLLHEQSSKYRPDDPNKPPLPKEYEDLSHYTLPPNLVPGPNESALDNSDFVREMVEGFPSRKTPRSTTRKRNKTTSKYKKKLADRSSTTLSPEAVELLKNFTTFSFLHLTPPSLEDDTVLPFPHEDLDPNYYTYRSKAWTTTNSTNASSTDSSVIKNFTTSELTDRTKDEMSSTNNSNDGQESVTETIVDEYKDFDSPALKGVENIEQTMGDFRANFSHLLDIVREYEKMVRVIDPRDDENISVDKTKNNISNHESRIKSLIRSKDVDRTNKHVSGFDYVISKTGNMDTLEDDTCKNMINDNNIMNNDIDNNVSTDCEKIQERSDENDVVQYNDYNDRIHGTESNKGLEKNILADEESNKMGMDNNGEDVLLSERTNLIEDILAKYCRENPTDFKNNLKKDAYYNTLRSVLALFIKEMTGKKNNGIDQVEATINEFEQQGENHSEIFEDEGNNTCFKVHNESDVNNLVNKCNDFEVQELSTMKPVIHRVNDVVVDKQEMSTVEMNIVTDIHDTTKSNDSNDYSQKNVANILKDIDLNPRNDSQDKLTENEETLKKEISENEFEDSSRNDKVIAETLLNNKLKEEIKRINKLINEINAYNKSVAYEHILIEKNASLHEIVEKLRTKRTVDLQRRIKRSETDGTKNAYMSEFIQCLEDYEAIKKRRKRQDNVETTETQPQDPRSITYDIREIRKPLRFKRSKSEEDYNAREAGKKGKKSGHNAQKKSTKELTSKEKYYFPRLSTHDPGGELWKQVKKDYETDPKIRKIIDESQIPKEEFTSREWNCKDKSPEIRKKRETKSEADYYEKEYRRKMKADHKKRVLDDESPETTEGTTPDLKFLDISRSKPKTQIDINDLGLSKPEEFIKQLRKRDLTNMNKDDVFERYDPSDNNFVQNLVQHVRRNRRHIHNQKTHKCLRKQKRDSNGGLMSKLIIPVLGNRPGSSFESKLRKAFLSRRRRGAGKNRVLSQENVDKMDYDMYHGLKYGITEVFEADLDLTGMYTRYTAATVGRYQMKRYEEFRKFYLDASSTFKDPFIKVSLAVCPFCGDYFGNREKLIFHENYNHFNLFSTVVPVTHEPTVTESKLYKEKDINDIFEAILKDPDLATASEKWGDYIDRNIDPTKRMEYRNLLFNESITAFKTVQVHYDEEVTTEFDPDVKVIAYPSDYHRKENFTYPKDLVKCANKSIPVVNLYENPEAFLKKLINHEPLLPEEQQR